MHTGALQISCPACPAQQLLRARERIAGKWTCTEDDIAEGSGASNRERAHEQL